MASSSSGFSASLAVTRKSATLNVLDIDPPRNPGTVHAVSRGVKARFPAALMRSREAVAIRVECRHRKHREETAHASKTGNRAHYCVHDRAHPFRAKTARGDLGRIR